MISGTAPPGSSDTARLYQHDARLPKTTNFPIFALFVAAWLETIDYIRIVVGDMALPSTVYQVGRYVALLGGIALCRVGWKESKRLNLHGSAGIIALGCFLIWNSVVVPRIVVHESVTFDKRQPSSLHINGISFSYKSSRGASITGYSSGAVYSLDAFLNVLLSFWQTMLVPMLFQHKLVLSNFGAIVVIIFLLISMWRVSFSDAHDPFLISFAKWVQFIEGIFVSGYCLWCFDA